MFKTKPGVYKMTNIITENFYIGSAKNISMRISAHKGSLKKGYKDNIRIRTDLNLHGKESFIFEVIEYCDLSITKEREQYYFELLKPTYNIWPTIYCATGRSYTNEQLQSFIGKTNHIKDIESFKKKLRDAWQRRKQMPNYKESIKQLDRTGKLHSEETKKLYSLQRRGKPKSPEHIENMKKARLGTKWDPINRTWIKLEDRYGI